MKCPIPNLVQGHRQTFIPSSGSSGAQKSMAMGEPSGNSSHQSTSEKAPDSAGRRKRDVLDEPVYNNKVGITEIQNILGNE